MNEYFHIRYEFSVDAVWGAIDSRVASGEPGYICVADGNVLQMVHRDQGYRRAVDGAMFSICDSSWVPMFLKWLYGLSLHPYCGSRIFEDALKAKKYRMLFLGTSDRILKPLKENLVRRYDARIEGMTFLELPFRKVEEFDYVSIAEVVNRDRPDIIWVALGAPKQELFMSRLAPFMERGVLIAVGAAFKFYSGVSERRAPEWMVRCHLEFLYRLFADPGKQLKRCWDIVTTLPAILCWEKRRGR